MNYQQQEILPNVSGLNSFRGLHVLNQEGIRSQESSA